MSLASASGLFAITVTPFDSQGRIDDASLEGSTDKYQDAGASGLTILGIMGEANKLDAAESMHVAKTVIKRANVPVVVGVSTPNFAAMRGLAGKVMDLGAEGVMVAPNAGLRSDEEIIGYFGLVVDAIGSDTPFVIQDYPLHTGVTMTPDVIRKIVETYPSCAMLKHEDWPGLDKLSALQKFISSGEMRPISILTGNGGMFLDLEMSRGAHGAMTGYAFPDMLSTFCRLHTTGDTEAAQNLFDVHLPMMRYEQQPKVGLAVRKYILQKRGFIGSDAQRKPGMKLSRESIADIENLLSRLARHYPPAAAIASAR